MIFHLVLIEEGKKMTSKLKRKATELGSSVKKNYKEEDDSDSDASGKSGSDSDGDANDSDSDSGDDQDSDQKVKKPLVKKFKSEDWSEYRVKAEARATERNPNRSHIPRLKWTKDLVFIHIDEISQMVVNTLKFRKILPEKPSHVEELRTYLCTTEAVTGGLGWATGSECEMKLLNRCWPRDLGEYAMSFHMSEKHPKICIETKSSKYDEKTQQQHKQECELTHEDVDYLEKNSGAKDLSLLHQHLDEMGVPRKKDPSVVDT